MRVVVGADCAPQPWANGGGTTRDLALEPRSPGTTADGPAFDWRLSLADIDRDGVFSRLPGVDRVFAPVEGAVALVFEARGGDGDGDADADADADAFAHADADAHAARDAEGPPLAFAGEAAPEARRVGAVRCRALNLMLARGRRAGAMRRVALADGAVLDPDWSRRASTQGAAVRACWLQRGRITVGEQVLEAGLLLVLESDDAAPRALGAALLLEVAIGPPGAAPTAPTAPTEIRTHSPIPRTPR
jgi:environmental stress-induced protein Ves